MSGLVAADIERKTWDSFHRYLSRLGESAEDSPGRNDWFPEEGFAIEERVIAEADQIVALCPQDRDDLINLYQADPEKITVIPNGFRPDEIYPLDKLFAGWR